MKLDKLVGERFKEKPADCVIDSHGLMVRGGYQKYVASGIFSYYAPLKKMMRKVEEIIRQEMDKIDGQEVSFPVVLPGTLWEESGRYESVGSELIRFKDRNNNNYVLGMTHEEAAVHLVREYGNTYTRYPFMIYQIQTKFRDEARPRGGLIRVREFTMKDAYSFHTSKEDMDEYYNRCYDAYKKIYARAGVPEVVVVEGDSGMMGGKISHEYMLLTPVGEDSIAVCGSCDYRANMEVAECVFDCERDGVSKEMVIHHTPNMETIDDVCKFLNVETKKSCKAVVYQMKTTDEFVIVFMRGDLEANETKLENYLGSELYPAVITAESGIVAGFIGANGDFGKHRVLFDKSLKGANNMVVGGNKTDYHYKGFDFDRDINVEEYHDFTKIATGSICPKCGEHSISIERGIEVGNIFQLEDKYTKTMNMQYIDNEGNLKHPIMGCYGIGVGRLIASVCEANHDEYGPIWPMSIAPYEVHLCCMRADNAEAKEYADKLYQQLLDNNIEVIYDDRLVSAGVMFSDADLLGVPVRVVVSPRNMKDGSCEIAKRDKSMKTSVPIEETLAFVKNLVNEELEKYQ